MQSTMKNNHKPSLASTTDRQMNRTFAVIMLSICVSMLVGCEKPPKELPTAVKATEEPPWPENVSNHSLAEGDISFEYLKWSEGLKLILVDDLKKGHSYTFSRGGLDARYSGVATGFDGQEINWEVKTTNGRDGSIAINGKKYDMSKGALIVVKAKESPIQIRQFQRDLSQAPFHSDRCDEYLRSDQEVMRFLNQGVAMQ